MPDEILDIRVSVERADRDVSIEIGNRWKEIGIGVDRGGPVYPEYEGPYLLTPTLYYQQLLETYGKSMRDDVRVNPIPISDVSNPQGGRTITIGA